VEKILLGHAYSRAIRAHILLQVALSEIICNEITLDENEFFKRYPENVDKESPSFKDVERSSAVTELKAEFDEKISEIRNRSPTAKLWGAIFGNNNNCERIYKSGKNGKLGGTFSFFKKNVPIFPCSRTFPLCKISTFVCSRHVKIRKFNGK